MDKSDVSYSYGLVYNVTCRQCRQEYMGEMQRTLKTLSFSSIPESRNMWTETYKLKHPWAYCGHGHCLAMADVKVLACEPLSIHMELLEAIHIHRKLTLNRNCRTDTSITALTHITWPLKSCDWTFIAVTKSVGNGWNTCTIWTTNQWGKANILFYVAIFNQKPISIPSITQGAL